MVAAVAGAGVWHNLFNAGGSELMLRAVNLFTSLGLNNMDAVTAATFAAELIGVALLSLIGWAFLRGLGRLYLWHLISDQSVLIDSLWFLFALTVVVDFAFFGGLWFLAPLGAFAIYKLIASWALLSSVKGRPVPSPSCSCCACSRSARGARGCSTPSAGCGDMWGKFA
jgi:hypothetical protein